MEELNRLFVAAKENVLDHAVLRFYIHTACRSAAACELLVADVWDTEANCCRPSGRVLEKFERIFTFPIDTLLGEALAEQIRSRTVDGRLPRYVFPSPSDPQQQWHRKGPYHWLRGFVKRTKIGVDFLHPHALRSTAATLLHKAGNSYEDIAAYLNHKSINTTKGYVDTRVSSVHDRMYIPWMGGQPPPVGPCVTADLLRAHVGPEGCVGNSSSSSSSSSNITKDEISALHECIQTEQSGRIYLQRQLAECNARWNIAIGLMSDAQRVQLQQKLDERTTLQILSDAHCNRKRALGNASDEDSDTETEEDE